MTAPTVILSAVGDVAACRVDPADIFRGCGAALGSGDLLFGQLETTITDRGAKAPNARLAMRCPPIMADAAAQAGFDVMSFAGNHCLDWGYEGFDDTLAHMARVGVPLCGAGQTLAAARAPVLMERGGLSFAFLAYSSILPEGYRAERNRPGSAPLRAHTLYEQVEYDQPGTPARILTRTHLQDLADLIADVTAASAQADIVILSLHWGVHMVEGVIALYQPERVHAAVAAGADAVIGHHPHILKGVEFIDGAPIFYSLGNFAIEQPQAFDPAIVETDSFRHLMSLNPTAHPTDIYVLPEDTRMTGIVRLHCTKQGVARTSFLPAWIADDSAPEMLPPSDPRFGRVATYLERISREHGLSLAVTPEGDALTLAPANPALEEAA